MLAPKWTKPWHRLAAARLALAQHSAALRACRAGEALLDSKAGSRSEFAALADAAALAAAKLGSLAGFDGRRLEVRF